MTATRRARWPWVLLIIVAVVAVLVVAAEIIARAVLPSVVRGIVIEQLDLPADQQIDVAASGILLPQLIGGRLDELHLSSEKVTIGGITGSADVTATAVPLQGGALGETRGTVAIDGPEFETLVARADLPIDSVEFAEPDVTVGGSIAILGASIPVSLTVTPGADAGELLLTPVSASLAGNEIDLQQLAGRLGAVGEQLAATQRICIADQLPAGITLTGLRIEGSRAVAGISADGRIAVDPALLENGVC